MGLHPDIKRLVASALAEFRPLTASRKTFFTTSQMNPFLSVPNHFSDLRLFSAIGAASFLLLGLTLPTSAQQAPSTSSGPAASASPSPSPSNPAGSVPTQAVQGLDTVTVIGQLNEARDQIVPDLGATKYSIGQTQIQGEAQGDNATFNQVILRAPGVAQDSYGQLHVRDEHANLQYRIDGCPDPRRDRRFRPRD